MIPIRTETSVRTTPWANFALIILNVMAYFVFDYAGTEEMRHFKNTHLILQADWPHLYQFFTYQFLHGSVMHLGGNLLFLWVFGGPVNGKMGQIPYLLFYLAGGIFAALGFALGSTSGLLGASGSIAAVTTAYLVLFPRSHVTVLFFFFFIGTFDIPAMFLIVFKVILWDNVLAPGIGGSGNVAHSAHLAGYFFGFVATLVMLWVRALPRDLFDMMALWKRWHQRREYAAALSDPTELARAKYGKVGRARPLATADVHAHDQHLDAVSEVRTRIVELLSTGQGPQAADEYEKLMTLDPTQSLSERQQVLIGRAFYESGRFPQAAAAFERYLQTYPRANDVDEVRLLLGVMYARDLRQFEAAEKHLEPIVSRLAPGDRRDYCVRWLREVRAALGKVAMEGS